MLCVAEIIEFHAIQKEANTFAEPQEHLPSCGLKQPRLRDPGPRSVAFWTGKQSRSAVHINIAKRLFGR
jgi:hypothetical protein